MPHARRVANDGPAIAVEFERVFERGVLREEAWADAKASQVQVSKRAALMVRCVDFCPLNLRSCAVSILLTKTTARAEGVTHWKQAAVPPTCDDGLVIFRKPHRGQRGIGPLHIH